MGYVMKYWYYDGKHYYTQTTREAQCIKHLDATELSFKEWREAKEDHKAVHGNLIGFSTYWTEVLPKAS